MEQEVRRTNPKGLPRMTSAVKVLWHCLQFIHLFIYSIRILQWSPGQLAQLVGVVPQTERSQVRFPVRAHAWVAG